VLVLVADKFEESGLEGLKKLGLDVDFKPDLVGDALTDALSAGGHEILIVRSTEVKKDSIDKSRLSLIIRAGSGYNTIDVAAASERGIRVTNCPGKNAQAVAELAFGLMIACDRRIADNTSDLRNGHWNKKKYSQAKGLFGRTLGLIGMGRISQEMVTRAHAFGMNITAFSRWMTPETAAAMDIGRAASLEELAKTSDFVSVHLSLNSTTKGVLDKKFFDALKPGSVFVNTSRGEVVNQEDFLAALGEGKFFAGLDVFEGEPKSAVADYDGPIKDFPNVYCTHHIGASTEQAQEAVSEETVRIVREYMLSGIVPNVVNVAKGEQANFLLIVRHADKVGVLAHVFDVLKNENVNVQEMENVVLGGSHSAIAQIAIDNALSKEGLVKIKDNSSIFDATCMAIQK